MEETAGQRSGHTACNRATAAERRDQAFHVKHTSVERRLTALVEEYGLSGAANSALRTILACLEAPDAPTAVRDARQAVDIHLADSLAGLQAPPLRGSAVVADVGAGAGLPGLALAAARPDTTVYEVESTGRKCHFIARVAQQAGLANLRVVHRRVEEWVEGRGACDVVCARALASLPVILEYAAPLLRVGGSVVAWKGRVDEVEAAAGAAAADMLGFGDVLMLPVVPFPSADRRSLHVFQKVRATPSGFPRRAGMAMKRPLGATPLHQ